MKIRFAAADDAGAACNVLRRSIEELCVLDHQNDPALKAEWLSNKTPERVRRWIAAPEAGFVVAEIDGKIVGVGAATARGDITLNYVAPEARFKGVSKAVLASLEAYLLAKGVRQSRLTSTTTAYGFYRAAGYADEGRALAEQTVTDWPMIKALG